MEYQVDDKTKKSNTQNDDEWYENHDISIIPDKKERKLRKKQLKQEKKRIKDEKWEKRHIPKPTKKELKLEKQIAELQEKETLNKKEEKKLAKLQKEYKHLYNYRHKKHTNATGKISCIVTSVVVVLVLVVGGLFGGLFFAYENFAKPYTGLSFVDGMKTFFGLYGANEKEIVTNPFDSKKESEAFLKGLQQSLYLSKEFTMDNLIQLIEKISQGETTVQEVAQSGNPPEQQPNPQNGTGNSYLDELLKDAKFDFSCLKDYDGTQKTDFFITDKMLASVMQEILLNADEIPQLNQVEEQLGMKISELASIKQAVIKISPENIATMSLTVKITTKTLVQNMLNKNQNIPFWAKNLLVGLVPKTTFITATITPKEDKMPTLGINSIDNKLLQTLLTNVDKSTNGQISGILKPIGTTIFNTFKTIDEFVGTNGLQFQQTQQEGGFISLDALQSTMYALNITNVTTKDFLLMVKHLHNFDINGISEEQYIEGLANYSTPQDFENNKVQLFGAFGIAKADANQFTAQNFIDKAKDIPALINLKNYRDQNGRPLYDMSPQELTKLSVMSDKALAQIFNEVINQNSQSGKMPFNLSVLELTLDGNNINIIGEINLDKLIEEVASKNISQNLIPLVQSLFPTQLYVKIITPHKRNADTSTISSNIIFNYTKDELSEQKSDNMVVTLENILRAFNPEVAENFKKDKLCKLIDDNIYQALDKMSNPDKTNNITFELKEGYIQLPCVYEVVANSLNKDTDLQEDKLTAEQIQSILTGYYNYDTKNVAFDENGVPINFVQQVTLEGSGNLIERELENKLFLFNEVNPSTGKKPIRNETIYPFMQNLGNNLTATNIDKVLNINAFKNNTAPANSKNIAFTSLEFAKIVMLSGELNKISEQFKFYQNFRIVNMSTTSELLKITVVGDLNKNYVIENPQASFMKIDNFASDYIVLQSTIDLTNLDNSNPQDNSAMVINNLSNNNTNKDLDILFKIINKTTNATAENSVDEKTINSKLKNSINNSLTEFKNQNLPLIAKSDIGNGQSGFTSDNIYAMIAKKISNNYSDGDDEILRSTIYKLNNLYVAESDQEPYVSYQFDTMKNTDTTGYDVQVDLPNRKTTINDVYLGKTIKQTLEKDNPNITLFKFATLTQNHAEYSNFATRLGVQEINDWSSRNSLFLQVQLNRAVFGNNLLLNKILPDNLYGGTFINMDNTKETLYFINNLNTDEMNYLFKVTSNDLTGDSPINVNLNEIINKTLSLNVEVVQGLNVTIDMLYKGSTFQNSNIPNCYGEFVYSF